MTILDQEQERPHLNRILDCSFRFNQFSLYDDVCRLKLPELGALWVPEQVISNS